VQRLPSHAQVQANLARLYPVRRWTLRVEGDAYTTADSLTPKLRVCVAEVERLLQVLGTDSTGSDEAHVVHPSQWRWQAEVKRFEFVCANTNKIAALALTRAQFHHVYGDDALPANSKRQVQALSAQRVSSSSSPLSAAFPSTTHAHARTAAKTAESIEDGHHRAVYLAAVPMLASVAAGFEPDPTELMKVEPDSKRRLQILMQLCFGLADCNETSADRKDGKDAKEVSTGFCFANCTCSRSGR